MRRETCSATGLLELPAYLAAARESNQRYALQRMHVYRGSGGPWMGQGHHRDDGLVGHRRDDDALGLLIRTHSYQRQVELPATHGLDEPVGVPGVHRDLHRGIAKMKLCDQRRDVDSVGCNRPYLDSSANQLGGFVDGALDADGSRESGPGVGQCSGTGRGEPDRALGSIEQWLTQFAFQPLDLGAHHRLRHVKLLRGAREIHLLADPDKVFQLTQLHLITI
jgi:hypothetical protein